MWRRAHGFVLAVYRFSSGFPKQEIYGLTSRMRGAAVSIAADVAQGFRAAGLFKDERYIHSPQSSEIEVEFPAGSGRRKCIDICANNYLGLSSHPEVIAAAHAGLDSRGYGMSSVRFIRGTQDIHRQLENRLTEFLGTEDTLFFLPSWTPKPAFSNHPRRTISHAFHTKDLVP